MKLFFSLLLIIGFITTFLVIVNGLVSSKGKELTELTADELRQLCPNEYKFCADKVAEGKCFGGSRKAGELKRKCPCSCNNAHHKRIQNCCQAVGKAEMEFCLPLCSYNTSLQTLGGGLGIKCVSQLTTWAYCAADAQDNTQCCQNKGVPKECLSFCQGKVPTCDLQSIFSYKPCLHHMQTITNCQQDFLAAKPQFDPGWEAPCEWE